MFASAFLAITLLSSPDAARYVADAQTGQGAWEIRVASTGVSLGEERGAQDMLARLRRATNELCTRELRTRVERDWHGCRRATLAQAVQTLNAPLVTRAYAARR